MPDLFPRILFVACNLGLFLPVLQGAKRTLTKRDEWANKIRKIVSPPDMLHEDGTINQAFFKPKKVSSRTALAISRSSSR
jgi:hypothetical protein